MSKSVNIDGNDYIIANCDSCPFYDDGDCGYDCHCQYPKSPSAIVGTDFNSERIAEDCPLKESGDQNELRRCPFCGSEAKIMRGCGEDWVQCVNPKCECASSMHTMTSQAIQIWNRRVKE